MPKKVKTTYIWFSLEAEREIINRANNKDSPKEELVVVSIFIE